MLKGNKYVIPAFLIALYNILFLQNLVLSLLLVVLEVIVLCFYLFKMNIEKYLCWLLIFLSSSIEFQALVSNNEEDVIYNFKIFRLFGFNLSVFFVLFPFVLVILKSLLQRNILCKKKLQISSVSLMLLALMIDGIAMGFINIVINDNGIRGLPNYIFLFFGEIYLGIWPIILFFLALYALIHSKTNGAELEKSLVAMMIANCVAPILPALFGVMGSYGTSGYMLVSSSAIFTPFLLLLPAYEKYKKDTVASVLFFILGAIVPMVFFGYVSGKHILLLLFIPLCFMLINIKSNKLQKRHLLYIAGIAFGLFISFSYLANQTGTLFESKFKEATSLLNVWEPNWQNSLQPSTGFRIFEAINVWLEYTEKPFQIFFGKGYMGSVRDYISGFGWDPSGSFPIEQFDNSTFYSLHEITGYLLKYGILGLIIWFFMLRLTFKNISNNPWIVIGCFWFLLLFGFSQTISIVGVISLAYGIFLIDQGNLSPKLEKLS